MSLAIMKSHCTPGNSVRISCIDLRTTAQKIEDLKDEMRHSSSKDRLNHLLLMQVYLKLEYGDISIENARAYLNLSKYYFHRKQHFLPQAKFHAMNARDILEQLQMSYDENILAYEIYFMLIQCSIHAKQRELKTNNKYILSIDKTHIEHDWKLLEKYFENLNISQKKKFNKDYLLLKFEIVFLNLKTYDRTIHQLIDEILDYFQENLRFQITFYQRCGFYLIHFHQTEKDGLIYYRKSVELAEQEEQQSPSIDHKYQLANAIVQRNLAKIRTERLTDEIENDFQRAIKFYRQPTGEMNRNALKIIDELANYYIKIGKYQDALNVLCESLGDKRRIFGDFSEEVIQTEARIGEIYSQEGECLNAFEHLTTCLELQEFVYGLDDPRTNQTRTSVELLKKDPLVSRQLIPRKSIRRNLNTCKKVSHVKTDLELLQTKMKE